MLFYFLLVSSTSFLPVCLVKWQSPYFFFFVMLFIHQFIYSFSFEHFLWCFVYDPLMILSWLFSKLVWGIYYVFCLTGVHVVLKTSSGVRYALYSLASSKPEPGGTMPKDCAAFLSQPGGKADIKLYPTGDVSYTIKYLNKVTRASQKTMLK